MGKQAGLLEVETATLLNIVLSMGKQAGLQEVETATSSSVFSVGKQASLLELKTATPSSVFYVGKQAGLQEVETATPLDIVFSTGPSTGSSTGPSTGPSAGPSTGSSAGSSTGPSARPSTGPLAGPSTGPSAGHSAGPSAGPATRPSTGTTPSDIVFSVALAENGGSSLPLSVADPEVKYRGLLPDKSGGPRTRYIPEKQVPHNFWYLVVTHAKRMMDAIPGKYKGTIVSELDQSSLLSLLASRANIVNRTNVSHLLSGGKQFL